MVCHFLLQGSFWPRDWTQIACIAGRFFNVWATREAGSSQRHREIWASSLKALLKVLANRLLIFNCVCIKEPHQYLQWGLMSSVIRYLQVWSPFLMSFYNGATREPPFSRAPGIPWFLSIAPPLQNLSPGLIITYPFAFLQSAPHSVSLEWVGISQCLSTEPHSVSRPWVGMPQIFH